MRTLRLCGIPCWLFPLAAGAVWLATLLAMIASWVEKDSTHYPEMWENQHLAYISNVGASKWGQPLFIGGSATTVVLFTFAFGVERWLRYKSELAHFASIWSVVLSAMAGLLTVVGSICLLIATTFDVRRHPYIHYTNAALFVLGYIFAGVFICAEKRNLSTWFPNCKVLRRSFWIKLCFVVGEFVMLFIGTITMFNGVHDPSVVMEWIIAMFFAFYMASFAVDFFAVAEVERKSGMIRLLTPTLDEESMITKPCKVHNSRLKRLRPFN